MICIGCQKEFTPNHHCQRFCCSGCRTVTKEKQVAAQARAYRATLPKEVRKCVSCGTEFTPVKGLQIYCTGTCRHNSQKARLKADRKVNLSVKKCETCTKEFYPSSWRQKYCTACSEKSALRYEIIRSRMLRYNAYCDTGEGLDDL